MKSLSLYHAIVVDELPLSLKIEGSDLEVRMGFRHSDIFKNNDLFARQKDFLSSDNTGNNAIFTWLGLRFAFTWHKTSVFVFDSHSRDRNNHRISNGQSVLLEFRSVKVLNLFILNYFGKRSAHAITSQYDVQHMKIIASENSVQNILESLRHKRKLAHDELSRKKKKTKLK